MRDEGSDEFRFGDGDDEKTVIRNLCRGVSQLRRDVDWIKDRIIWAMAAGATVGAIFVFFSRTLIQMASKIGGGH